MIRSGQVGVNGTIRRDPEALVRVEHDRIAVNGRLVEPPAKIYLLMNKPRGAVTSASDEKGRETVYSVLASSRADLPAWIPPVGRLDKASEGLLLLTNDSEWGARIAAPESHLNKTYHVQVSTVADEKLISTLIRGVKTKEGELLRARQARRLRAGGSIEVLRLVRVAIGPLRLGDLAKGEHRALTANEKRILDRAMKG